MCYLLCCCSQAVAVLAAVAVNHFWAVRAVAVTADHKNSVFCTPHSEPQMRVGVLVDKLWYKSGP